MLVFQHQQDVHLAAKMATLGTRSLPVAQKIIFCDRIMESNFTSCMALFIVNKSDLLAHPEFETEVSHFCEKRIESEKSVAFEPKPGFLATFGVFLTEKGISYQLEFEKTSLS
jgi:hypothetical protein